MKTISFLYIILFVVVGFSLADPPPASVTAQRGPSRRMAGFSERNEYKFILAHGAGGSVFLWRCDQRTGEAWWTASAPGQCWHKIAEAPAGPNFPVLPSDQRK